MTYTVVWTSRAEAHLADVWMAASDRNAVAVAAHRVENDLRIDPLDVGESRASNFERIDYRHPLGLTFVVAVDEATVFVTGVWLVK